MPGAVGLLKQAIAADPEWASPELAFAELLAEAPETLAEARRHAQRAVDLAEEEEEYLSALALKAGLEAEAGDVEAARKTLAELPPPEVALGDPGAAIEIADLHLDVDRRRAGLGDGGGVARARLRGVGPGRRGRGAGGVEAHLDARHGAGRRGGHAVGPQRR